MVDDTSAPGLRHVGYGILSDLFRESVGVVPGRTGRHQGVLDPPARPCGRRARDDLGHFHGVLEMTLGIFKEPTRMLYDTSAPGQRHVGYGIPPDLRVYFIPGS